MDALIPLGVVVLSAVVHATFQLGLGTLLLLYHASLGRHVRIRTRKLASAFIAGFGIMILLTLASICFFLWAIFSNDLPFWVTWIIISALVAFALVTWCLYYRHKNTTELWLPKAIAHYIDRRAKLTTSKTEAFSLGLLACFGEFPLTLILIIASASAILDFTEPFRASVVALYTIIVLVPLVVLRLVIRRGATVVEIQKWRLRSKLFLRTVTSTGLLILAIFLIAFKLMVG